jgi:hypothetical protein
MEMTAATFHYLNILKRVKNLAFSVEQAFLRATTGFVEHKKVSDVKRKSVPPE